MDKPEFKNSTVWTIVEKALREYGTQLVADMRVALNAGTELGKERAVAINGSLTAVDQMLALPETLFPSAESLSDDKQENKVPVKERGNGIRRFGT